MKTTTISPEFIEWHRLIQDMPRWAEQSQEMNALVEDVSERGIDQPLIVCRTQDGGETPGSLYLLDGRHRHRAALMAGLSEVPIIERDEADAVGIIFSSITQRRHFTKGALAYQLYPVMCASAQVGPGRPKSNLSTESTIILDLCIRAGFSRDLYFQAKSIHEAFAKRPDLIAEYEPRILAGEIGLGACVAGLAGKDATEGGARNDRSLDQLFLDGFKALKTRFTRWDTLETAGRRVVAHEAADTVLSMPEEVQDTILKAIRAARKN